MKTIFTQLTSTTPTPAIAPELLFPLALIAIGMVSNLGFGLYNAVAADKDENAEKVEKAEEKEKEKEKEKDPNLVYSNDFDDEETGRVPGNYFVLDGDFEIAELEESEGGGKALKMLEEPLVEGSIQFGSSLESGGSVKVRAKANKRGRSYPRFGVGMHGMKGYRLRVAPAAKKLELVLDQEVIQSVPIEWQSGIWYFVELEVLENNNSWTVYGRAWAENAHRPASAQVDYISVQTGFRGKASITGTPYAELPILFDDLEIRRADSDADAAGKTE